ncbi:hypothetical protein RBWH47_01411 [Rhodopirellula baltica WH47]|uniref:Uncharacterized protein n=1 Tax=Rhodopirellula baltica WH47 TaxID=991778 RepID=F2AZB8_RHOBT|nr:hypothetical protein RBWH47_01411 [Rhodopirellula baltica WH47]
MIRSLRVEQLSSTVSCRGEIVEQPGAIASEVAKGMPWSWRLA